MCGFRRRPPVSTNGSAQILPDSRADRSRRRPRHARPELHRQRVAARPQRRHRRHPQPGHGRGDRHRAGVARPPTSTTPWRPRPRAFPEWAAKTPRERSEAIHELARRIEADIENLSAIESENVGKPVSIMEFEMDLTLDNWKFFASAGRFLEGRAAGEYMAGYTSMLRREPLGVIGSIAPWNYPLNMATWKVAPGAHRRQHRRAQAVRAHAVHRAAARRAGRRRAAARRAQRRVRPGRDGRASRSSPTPTSPWCRSPARWRPARPSPRPSSETLKRVHLELGGKAPVVVFDDADAGRRRRRRARGRLLQLRPGLHRRLPRDRRPEGARRRSSPPCRTR